MGAPQRSGGTVLGTTAARATSLVNSRVNLLTLLLTQEWQSSEEATAQQEPGLFSATVVKQ